MRQWSLWTIKEQLLEEASFIADKQNDKATVSEWQAKWPSHTHNRRSFHEDFLQIIHKYFHVHSFHNCAWYFLISTPKKLLLYLRLISFRWNMLKYSLLLLTKCLSFVLFWALFFAKFFWVSKCLIQGPKVVFSTQLCVD